MSDGDSKNAGYLRVHRAPGSQWDAVARQCGLAAAGLHMALLARTCWRGGGEVDGAACDQFGHVVVPVRKFVEHLGSDRKTVRRLIGLLEDKGFVTVTQKARRGRGALPLVLRIEPIAGEMPIRGLVIPTVPESESRGVSPPKNEDLREKFPQSESIYGRNSPTHGENLPQFGPQLSELQQVEVQEEVGRTLMNKIGEEGPVLNGRGSLEQTGIGLVPVPGKAVDDDLPY